LPPDVTKRDIDDHFTGCGPIVDCRIMGGFAFLEFGSSRDAEDVIRNYVGKPFKGVDIIVEPAKETGRRRDTYDAMPPRSTPRGGRGIRVLVKGISADVSWQDLKDFGREGGPVIFADVDRQNPGVGILEYPTMPDADAAVARLRELDIRGVRPDVIIDDAPPPPPSRDYPPRDDYRRGPPPPRDDYYRRDRSPPRRDRSPPRYDDRRGNGYADRRDRSPPRRDRSPRRDDYRRDRSPRRDDYRRDDRDRTTDRAPEPRAAPIRGERGGDLA
jgi:arginine/serine-rich splicing factor 4/5/6